MKNVTKPVWLVLLYCLLIFSFDQSLQAQNLYINEILASNSNTNTDEFGQDDDWIEIYNDSPIDVNIGGMYLTDDMTNLAKWFIPASQPSVTTIPAFGYLLIWCDDEAIQGPLHAPFKLSASGESIALVDSDGTTVLDNYTFGPQSANISIGREQDAETPWVFFTVPTPEEDNSSGNIQANMPVATAAGGHYNNAFTVSLSTNTTGGVIYYTTDGSEPTDNDSEYNNPLTIDETTVLRARTFSNGMDPSRTMTHTYLFGIDHEFPIFCLSTADDNFFGDDEGIYENFLDPIEQPIHVELFEADGTFGFRQDMGVQIHGRHSQTYPHKGLSFRTRNQYGNNKINYALFPEMPFDEYGSFILRASGNDWKRMLCRDACASSLIRDMADVDSLIKDPEVDMQGYRPAVVYLNGEYFGIHNLREKLDFRYLKTHHDIPKGAADLIANTQNVEHGEIDAWEAYQTFIEGADFNDPADLAEIKANIDLDHFMDYFIFNIYIDNNDWPGNNNRRWRLREEGQKWRYWIYDLDGSFGLNPLSDDYNSGDWTSPSVEMVMAETETYSHNEPYSTLLLRKLMENDSLRVKFINRMADQLNVLFTSDRVLNRIDEFEAVYVNEIPQHADFWWDGDNDWAGDMDIARLFATHRTEEVFNQYRDFFTDNIDEVVELTMTAAPIAGGEIHLNTMNLYTEQYPWTGTHFSGIDVPLYTIPNPGYIFTGWTPASLGDESATTMNLSGDETITAHFSLGSTQTGNIVINEINYNSPDNCDAGDWIELYNAGTDTVDISGWFLEDGSGNYFNIPHNTSLEPDSYLVLAQDQLKFTTVHPTVTNYIGGFGNSITGGFGLSNGGEWISINNANRSFQDTVHYLDNTPWPLEADGTGPSLELINPGSDNALAQNWFALAGQKGSPGKVNQGSLNIGEDMNICDLFTTLTLNASYASCDNCTYLWNNSSTQSSVTVNPILGTNTYIVTVTDANGITQTDDITVVVSSPFELNTQTETPCYATNNGTIDLDVNGTGTYTYNWSNGATTQDLQNLSPDTYTVTVTNDGACTHTETVEILSNPELILESQVSQILCHGDLGAIDLTVQGGSGAYSYTWSNGATVADQNDLSSGIYNITITDANNCTLTESYQFNTAPAELVVSLSTSDPTCFGVNEGNIEADVTGGQGAYTYAWSNGVVGTEDEIEDLSPGIYQLTVTDENACSWTGMSEVVSLANITSSLSSTPLSCPGGSNGSASVSVNGGTEPYTYLWENAQTGSTAQNLSSGFTAVTITDQNNCQHYDSIFISEPVGLSVTSAITAVNCYGGNTGGISVTASGGAGILNYEWFDGTTNNSISNLAEGNYNITITDANNCAHIEEIYVSEAPQITFDLDVDPVSCFGETDGEIEVEATGGTGVFNYNWSNGTTGDEAEDLTAGTYTLTITDQNNCQVTEVIDITQPTAITASFATATVTCFNGNNGTIETTASGGTGDLDYEWSNGTLESATNNLTEGNYELTITDENDCELIESVFVAQAPEISVTSDINTVTCFGGDDGQITATAIGGTGTLNYEWADGTTTPINSGLSAGTYQVLITDDEGCQHTEEILLSSAPEITLNAAITPTSCVGLSDGNITVDVTGGTGTLSYSWENGTTENTIGNLSGGDYNITITDANNCEQTESINLPDATAIAIDFDISPISCHNENSGSIIATANGGTENFSYQWDNGLSTNEIENLNAGSYEVTVTDSNNCTSIESLSLTEPAPLSLNLDTDFVSCFDGSDGMIVATAAGGTGTISYEWSNGTLVNTAENLSEGIYNITITDANNCTYEEQIEISQPSAIALDVELAPVSCFDGENGAITVSASGGNGNYQFSWDNGASSAEIANLSAGAYVVTVIDDNNCEYVENILLPTNSPISTTLEISPLNCSGDSNGSIDVTATGGFGEYDYNWNTGGTENNINNLSEGTYNITITDENNCAFVESISIAAPEEISLDFSTNAVGCFEGNDGSLTALGEGGTGTLSYEWSTGSTGASAENLTAGTYEVTLTDNNECTYSESITLTEAPAITVQFETVLVSCFGGNDGSIVAAPNGGTGSFDYEWNNGASSFLNENLSEGSYEITVTDENGCEATEEIYLAGPAEISAAFSVESISCFEETDGSISVLTTGGTGTYDYVWDNGSTENELADLSAGTYELTITDQNDCIQIETIEVADAEAIDINVAINPITCFDAADGSIAVNANGGTGDLNYEWNNGTTEEELINLPEGEYNITITDANGCEASGNYFLSAPPAINIDTETDSVTCHGGTDGTASLNASGGTGNFEYNWDNGNAGDSFDDLSVGTYNITITDNGNCDQVETIVVEEPDATIFNFAIANVNCNAATDGSATATLTGGTAPFNYNWSNGGTTSTIEDLGAGNYTLTVTDNYGCESTESLTVTQPTELSAEATSTNPVDIANGSITITTSGGTSPYTILWEDGATDFDLTDLGAGDYMYTITDANGCTVEETITLELLIDVETLEEHSLSVYPNPSKGIVYIENDLSEMDVAVIDLLGRTV
ncbi:MAG: CotH kinase family protein, partial [Saprospiraceae bacterium]